jgi:transcriptional regulator with XRE-family HTH domain
MNYFNYFTEIEDAFIRRRGKHLLLSPLDWALIEGWKARGVPLHIVLRGVEQSFDSYEAKPRRRSVKSLFYCQEEVEAQYAEWLESQVGGGETSAQTDAAMTTPAQAEQTATGNGALPFPREVIAGHLAESRAQLERAAAAQSTSGAGELCEALGRAAARLSELEKDFAAAARPDAEQLEGALNDLENLLDRALRADLAPARLAARTAEAAAQLEPYRKRMERATYEQTLDSLLAKLLREEANLPRLSLFYL